MRAIVEDLQAEIARAQQVIDSVTKNADDLTTARACKRIAQAAIDLADFVKDA